MSFEKMMRDQIKLIKSNGQEFDALKANVQSKNIYLMRSDVLIEPNDIIQRVMSNGGVETFKVIDPGFFEKSHSIPAHYQMEVQKLDLPEAKKMIQSTIYNLNGPNARVNNRSIDNSSNALNLNQDVSESLISLSREIEKLSDSNEDKKDAREVVEAIQGQFESGKPSKAVIKTLISALPPVGSIASIGSFLLSAIG